jgi:hypothetical protein
VSTPVVVGFVLSSIIAAVGFSLWWGHDNDISDVRSEVAELKQALNLGGEPLVVVDPPKDPIAVPTEPMELDVAGGLRTTRPTPFVRQKGRHAA